MLTDTFSQKIFFSQRLESRQNAHATDSGLTFEESGSIPGDPLEEGISWSSQVRRIRAIIALCQGILLLAKEYCYCQEDSSFNAGSCLLFETKEQPSLIYTSESRYGSREPAVKFLTQSDLFGKKGANYLGSERPNTECRALSYHGLGT